MPLGSAGASPSRTRFNKSPNRAVVIDRDGNDGHESTNSASGDAAIATGLADSVRRGIRALALVDLLAGEAAADASWRRPATARSVIFLFMEGGPSHLDTFDPKPELTRLAGQSLPPSFKPVITPMGEGRAPLMASQRKWKQHGASGLWVSDWLPHIATCIDDIAVIRSCWSNGLNHVGGVCQMNTGSTLAGRPSLGSWVSYGLGTENENLPGFVVMHDFPRSQVAGGPRNWGTGFMPAVYQGTRVDGGAEPLANLKTPAEIGEGAAGGKARFAGPSQSAASAVAPGSVRA